MCASAFFYVISDGIVINKIEIFMALSLVLFSQMWADYKIFLVLNSFLISTLFVVRLENFETPIYTTKASFTYLKLNTMDWFLSVDSDTTLARVYVLSLAAPGTEAY